MQPASFADEGQYDVVITDLCSTATSTAAAATLIMSCAVDFDCSGSATVPDIFAFLALWFANDPRADFDGSGLPVTVPDIFASLSAWFAGCP